MTVASSPSGSPARFTKLEKIHAPISTEKSEAEVSVVSSSTSRRPRQLSPPRAQAMRKAPAAPMPAASVGEKARWIGQKSKTP